MSNRLRFTNGIITAVILLGISVCSGVQAAVAKPVLNIKHWQTQNKVPVYFVSTAEIPMIDINVVFTAGSAYDQSQWGIAALTAGLLGEGAKQQDATMIAESFANAGAQYDGDVDRDMAVQHLRSLVAPQYFTPALATFVDVLTAPSFTPTAFARVKQQTLIGIKQQQQDPQVVATLEFYKQLYQKHPYAHPVSGTADSVTALTRDNVAQFYQRYYNAQNAKIVLVGDLTLAQAKTVAEHIATRLASGQPAPQLAVAKPLQQPVLEHTAFPAKQTTIMFGQLGITPDDPTLMPLLVGNTLLGNMPLDSLLFQQVRNKRGLAYAAYSGFSLKQYRGPFVVQLQTRATKSDQALTVAQKTLADFVANGPDEQQLAQAKQFIINGFPLSLSTNQKMSDILVRMVFYKRPLDYLDTYRDKVWAVTRAQVKQAFNQLIKPRDLVTVTVGPNQQVKVSQALQAAKLIKKPQSTAITSEQSH